jgi:hypothetical protein
LSVPDQIYHPQGKHPNCYYWYTNQAVKVTTMVYDRSVTIQNFYHDTYRDILDKWRYVSRYVLWHFVYLCVHHHFFLLRICHIRPWKLKLIFEKKTHNIYVAKQILI